MRPSVRMKRRNGATADVATSPIATVVNPFHLEEGGLKLFDYAMTFLCTTGTLLLFFHCFYLHFLSIIQLSLWFPPRYLS